MWLLLFCRGNYLKFATNVKQIYLITKFFDKICIKMLCKVKNVFIFVAENSNEQPNIN